MVGKYRLRFAELRERRPDMVHIHVEGKSDGSPAVDYTVNAEIGVPYMTGPANTDGPVNHVVPAWDLLTGMKVANAAVAALLQRSLTGEGAQIEIALADVALAGVGDMGWLAEVELRGAPRARHGNHMFGSFGNDFTTSDGRRVMVVALTEGQWRALRDVTETGKVFEALEGALGADLNLETDRYRLRETIAAVLRPWFAQRDFATVSRLLTRSHVLWSPYRDMAQAAALARKESPLTHEIEQPGIGPMLATGSPVRWNGDHAGPVEAPVLGADTDAILRDVLGLQNHELDRLCGAGVIGRAR
jgi:2-methylfumaryl-CoA isomerase